MITTNSTPLSGVAPTPYVGMEVISILKQGGHHSWETVSLLQIAIQIL